MQQAAAMSPAQLPFQSRGQSARSYLSLANPQLEYWQILNTSTVTEQEYSQVSPWYNVNVKLVGLQTPKFASLSSFIVILDCEQTRDFTGLGLCPTWQTLIKVVRLLWLAFKYWMARVPSSKLICVGIIFYQFIVQFMSSLLMARLQCLIWKTPTLLIQLSELLYNIAATKVSNCFSPYCWHARNFTVWFTNSQLSYVHSFKRAVDATENLLVVSTQTGPTSSPHVVKAVMKASWTQSERENEAWAEQSRQRSNRNRQEG